MGTIYGTTITMLRRKCSEYRRKKASLDDLKSAVWQAAQEIESSDEYELRKSLQTIEGRLDVIQFTTDSDKVFDATLLIVEELEELLQKVV